MKSIGERIMYLRKNAGLTQEQLGERLNISGQAVSKWEKGGVPDISLLPAIADVFGVTTDHLFGRERDISDKTEDEILKELFDSCHHYFEKGEGRISVQKFLFEAVWRIQSAYIGSGTLFELDDVIEKNKDNEQITSQLIDDNGTTYFSLVKGFPLFCMVKDDPGISERLLAEDKFSEFFSVLGTEAGMKTVLFSQYNDNNAKYTVEALADKLSVDFDELKNALCLLVKYGFLLEEQVIIDGKTACVYHTVPNPQTRVLLMTAYQYIHDRRCCYNFVSNRTKPYI